MSLSEPPNPPSVAAVKNEIASDGKEDTQQSEFEKIFGTQSVNQKAEYTLLNLKGLKDHFSQKKVWSYFVMVLLSAVFVSQIILLYLVGFGYMDFVSYTFLLHIFLMQNLGQIVILAYVIVKSFFRQI